MKFLKPKFWNKKNNPISLILIPITFLFQLVLKIRKTLTFENVFKIPIICIGNIYIGGTGKTPLSVMVTKELINKKKNPALIKKYYSAHYDEHNLINDKINCLILNNKRSKAILDAKKKGHNIVILDDGLQDYTIKKDLNIACFNTNQLIGNGMTLPSGPLRESMQALKNVQIVVLNGPKNILFEKKILKISKKIKIFYSKYIPTDLGQLKNKKLLAFAGIGNPENFFNLLRKNKLNVKKTFSFPDHYEFSKSELKKINDYSIKNSLQVITTEKDYYRIKKYGFKNFKFLKIQLLIKDKNKFMNIIANYL